MKMIILSKINQLNNKYKILLIFFLISIFFFLYSSLMLLFNYNFGYFFLFLIIITSYWWRDRLYIVHISLIILLLIPFFLMINLLSTSFIRSFAIFIIVFSITTIIIERFVKAKEKLKESQKKYLEAYNHANFYKDLFMHDMGNILQAIFSSNEIASIYLKNGNKINEMEEFLKNIDKQVKRGIDLTLNVRKLSQLEGAPIYTQPTEIIAVLNEAKRFVLKSFHDKEINIKIDNLFEKITIQANELLIDMFENILINAVKHNENPIIEIIVKISKAEKEGVNYNKIEFIDNGRGIPDNMKEKIFQQESDEYKKISEMRLGLSLVLKIVERYNGNIWVEDKVKGDHTKGSNFIVLLPEVGQE